jgi:hypothetical protein
LRIPRVPLALIAAANGFIGAGTEAAWGGAWLLPPGDGQVIADTFFSDSNRAFDAHGQLVPVPSYRKFELGTYIEYGLTNWLTLVASPSYDRIQNPPPGQSYNGLGESEIAARVGLYRSDASVLSFQAGLRSPGASFADSLGPFAVRPPHPSMSGALSGTTSSSRRWRVSSRRRPAIVFTLPVNRASFGSI